MSFRNRYIVKGGFSKRSFSKVFDLKQKKTQLCERNINLLFDLIKWLSFLGKCWEDNFK